MNEQVLGLLTGIIFGALLQQGRVLRFEKQVGALLLKDMTIIKFMLSAILVGMVGLNILSSAGIIAPSIKNTVIGANLIGGILFGAGWAIMGYCPGTSVGAIAEGRWHAVWAVLGMLAGAALFAEAYPFLSTTVMTWGDYGKTTLPSALGLNPWVIIPIVALIYLALFRLFEKKGL